jgi:hypothetical protein
MEGKGTIMKVSLITLLSLMSLSAGAISQCPEMISFKTEQGEVAWTKDILIPSERSMPRMHQKFARDGFFSYKVAAKVCREVTKACGARETFVVPTEKDWKVFLKESSLDQLEHPRVIDYRGYWASDKGRTVAIAGVFPLVVESRGVLSTKKKTLKKLDAGALMAVKCVAKEN